MHTVYYIRFDPLANFVSNRQYVLSCYRCFPVHTPDREKDNIDEKPCFTRKDSPAVLAVCSNLAHWPSHAQGPAATSTTRGRIRPVRPSRELCSIIVLSENPSTKQTQTLHVAIRRHRDQTLHLFQSSRWYADQCFSTQIYPLLTR